MMKTAEGIAAPARKSVAHGSPAVTVIVPVYNEVGTIARVVSQLIDELPCEVILIDDGSTDGSSSILLSLAEQHTSVRTVDHASNRGKGAAIRTGLRWARGSVVTIFDADFEYSPLDLPDLVKPILAGEADVVYGNRFHGPTPGSVPLHRAANRLITRMCNVFLDQQLHDVETCLKAVRRSLLDDLVDSLREDRFGIEIELTMKLASIRGVRFAEVPISYQPRSRKEGKKIGWRDGVSALRCILKYGLVRTMSKKGVSARERSTIPHSNA